MLPGLIGNVGWITSAGAGTDPYFANVVLLLNFDGVNGATSFTDLSPSAHTVTTNGNAALSNTTSPFGTTALALDGTGDYLSIPDSANWEWPLQFTIEAWVYKTFSSGAHMIVAQRTNLGAQMFLEVTSGQDFGFQMPLSTGAIGVSGGAATSDVWTFVAVDRDATGKTRFYTGGSMISSDTDADTAAGTNIAESLYIGSRSAGGNAWQGYIGAVRITKGVARYASDGGHAIPSTWFPTS